MENSEKVNEKGGLVNSGMNLKNEIKEIKNENKKEIEKKEKFEKRKAKVNEWLKNPYNIVLLAILIFAFSIRLYYFSQTYNQPLWWDEADYMSRAKYFATGNHVFQSFSSRKPLFLPFFFSLFLRLGLGEIFLRIIELFLSIAAVFLIYLVGKKIFNEKIGLISAFCLSVLWTHLFYSYRLLLDVPTMFLVLLSIYFFWSWYKTEKSKYVYFTALFTGIGFLVHYFFAFLIVAYFIFIIVTKKEIFLKKEIWIALLIGLIVISPQLIWNYYHYSGNPIGTWYDPRGGGYTQTGGCIPGYECGFFGYLKSFPFWLSWPFLIFFAIGFFILIFNFIIGFDMLKKINISRSLFILLWFFSYLIFLSSNLAGHVEDRYFFSAFPAMLITLSLALDKISDYIMKYKKILAIIFVLIVLCLGAYYQLNFAKKIIDVKKNSYQEIKDAGLWFKNNIEENDTIVTSSVPQITYYSERKTISPSKFKNETSFLDFVKREKPSYFMLSIFESYPNWAYKLPEKNETIRIEPVQAWIKEIQGKKQPIVIIYRFVY